MTTRQFLSRLRGLNVLWIMDNGGGIRATTLGGLMCPITGVKNAYNHRRWFSLGSYRKAGKALGLRNDQITRIVQAADNSLAQDPRLRRALLRACRLA